MSSDDDVDPRYAEVIAAVRVYEWNDDDKYGVVAVLHYEGLMLYGD